MLEKIIGVSIVLAFGGIGMLLAWKFNKARPKK